MFDTLVGQMKDAEGVIEQLKEENQMEWVRKMMSIENMANEYFSHSKQRTFLLINL